MKEYQITVKPWMLKSSSEDFDFMAKYNNDIPMPLMIMYTGGKLDESQNMVKFVLHGDIKSRVVKRCMRCGEILTNPVSQYFGMGPVCGNHNYTNPFSSEEALNRAVGNYRQKLVNTVWTGWIPKSAIVSIDDDRHVRAILADMPIEIDTSPVLGMVNDTVPTQQVAAKPEFTITARIDKPVRCTDDHSVFVSFPYNKAVVAAVKALRARFWSPDTKEWEIEYKELGELKSALPDITFEITNEDIVPAKEELPVDYHFKTTPMKHQIEGIQYGLEHSRFLLGDDMGLGKSKQIIDLACIRKQNLGIKHCLIVCGVNSLKWNWVEEVAKHSNEGAWILGQIRRKRSGKLVVGGNPDKIVDLDKLANPTSEMDYPYFIITNVESLRNAEIAEKIKHLCDTGILGMVAVDEAHRCKNLETLQGAGLMQVQPYYRAAMTGTPLINTPLDLYALLKWLGYEPYAYKQFKYHFCEFDQWGSIVGYKNIDQLRNQLGAIMIRRTKKEVLDLPDKVYMSEYVDLTSEQVKLYNQVIDKVIEDPELADKLSFDCLLAVKQRLRQVSGGIAPFTIKTNPKLDRMEQLVEEAVYSGTKVIVYSNWIGGINPALERLQKYNPVVLTGETKDSDRQTLVNRFQNDPSVKVFCATIGAAGVGLTLTAATEVIFLDEPWNNATKEQAIDRCHRIGTTSKITIHTIMAYGTYDVEVHDIVLGKKILSDTFVDKKDLKRWKI